jgi:hypothetical protein
MIFSNYDQIPMSVIYIFIMAVLFLAAEFGFYIGKVRKNIINAGGEDKQTGSIMGASLGLLAFLLAFSFNIVSNIHSERKSLVVDEANAISTLYLRTEMFELEQAKIIRDILKDYVDMRVYLGTVELSNEKAAQGFKASESMQMDIWDNVLEIIKFSDNPMKRTLVDGANKVIDIHAERVNAAFLRLPIVSLFLLLFIAMLTLGLMGYQSGLSGIRVLLPRTALILSLTTVMIVILDLDRPGSNLIEVSQKTMLDLQEQLATSSRYTDKL